MTLGLVGWGAKAQTPLTTEALPVPSEVDFDIQSCQRADSEDAIIACQRLLAVITKDNRVSLANAYNNIGVAYAKLERFADAAEMYKKAIAENPSEAVYHYGLGMAYANQKLFKKALKVFKSAIRLQPNEPNYNFVLGITYANLGDTANAQAFLQKAIAVWDTELANNPGYFAINPGAQKSYETAKSLLPD